MLSSYISKLCLVTGEIVLGEPSCLIRTLREIIGSCVQIYNVLQGYFSLLPDVPSLNTRTFGPYAQISDEELGYFSYCLQFGLWNFWQKCTDF